MNTPVPEPVQPDRLYSASDAARALGVSPRTIERWRRTGIGPRPVYTVPGAHPRYRGMDLLALVRGKAEPDIPSQRRG